MSPHHLAVDEGCFDGRETWMELADRYLDDYAERYKEMERKVRRLYGS